LTELHSYGAEEIQHLSDRAEHLFYKMTTSRSEDEFLGLSMVSSSEEPSPKMLKSGKPIIVDGSKYPEEPKTTDAADEEEPVRRLSALPAAVARERKRTSQTS
jgi:hypothetical protein